MRSSSICERILQGLPWVGCAIPLVVLVRANIPAALARQMAQDHELPLFFLILGSFFFVLVPILAFRRLRKTRLAVQRLMEHNGFRVRRIERRIFTKGPCAWHWSGAALIYYLEAESSSGALCSLWVRVDGWTSSMHGMWGP